MCNTVLVLVLRLVEFISGLFLYDNLPTFMSCTCIIYLFLRIRSEAKIGFNSTASKMKSAVLTGSATTMSLSPPSLHHCTKRELLEYFENTYSLDEWIFTSLKDESTFYKCPDRLRLPLIFYYCHPAVVYINKLLLAGCIKERVNEEFETMFETGVDEMSWDDTENYRMGGCYQWPKLAEVVNYRRMVREVVQNVILQTDLEFPVTKESPWWAVWMGIEHERIHLETSSVLIRQLPVDLVEQPVGWKYGPLSTEQEVYKNRMVRQAGSSVRLGKSEDCPAWGWDNEYGSLGLDVPAFECSKYMVTNRQMLEFVKAGGYDKEEFWSEEGWSWKNFRQAKHPNFWVCHLGCKSNCGSALSSYSHCKSTATNSHADYHVENKYRLRLMFDVVPLPLDWPVEVNYHEAKAFCAWADPQYRLPTEAEQHVIRGLEPFDPTKLSETDPIYDENVTEMFNINLAYGSSTPVNMFPASERSGCHDTFGNVWEWVEDHFNGIPGFATSKFYADFSAPCFDGHHTMILGGSWISTGNEASRFARFAFRRHFIQHAGFRICRTLKTLTPLKLVKTPVYILGCPEDHKDSLHTPCGIEPILQSSSNAQYIEDSKDTVLEMIQQQFPQNGCSAIDILSKRIRSLAWEATQPQHASRVLLIGCGPGRMAFDLSSSFGQVTACDTSARCIAIAELLKEKGQCDLGSCDVVTANDNSTGTVIRVPKHTMPEKITFKQLTWIPCELRNFNLVINLYLDRADNPKAWIIRMKELVQHIAGGKGIFITSKWSNDKLKAELEPELVLRHSEDVELENVFYCFSVWQAAAERE